MSIFEVVIYLDASNVLLHSILHLVSKASLVGLAPDLGRVQQPTGRIYFIVHSLTVLITFYYYCLILYKLHSDSLILNEDNDDDE